MTIGVFRKGPKGIEGFRLHGHCTTAASDEAGKVLCSAVSSAAYLAVNTLTDVMHIRVNVRMCDGTLDASVQGDVEAAQTILKGLQMHLESLAQQHKDRLNITTEVC